MTNPVLAVTQPDGSRKYVHPLTGETVSSITTIIKAGIPTPWMGPWAARKAAEHALANWDRLTSTPPAQCIREMKNAHKQYARERADIGDIVHNIVECWSTGKPYPDPPKEVHSYIDRFIDFLTGERPRFIENEVTLWSRQYNYAGTADFIIEIDGKTWLADLKCMTRDTIITLADGREKLACDVHHGDEVAAWNENTECIVPSKVIASGDNGIRPVYRVRTKCGRTVTVTAEHPFLTRQGWVKASGLIAGRSLVRTGSAVPGDRNTYDIDTAYYVGLAVGDGYTKKYGTRITTTDPMIVSFLERFAAGDKFVPDCILSGGRDVWLHFLAGYLDTDGSVRGEHKRDGGCLGVMVSWSSKSERLLRQCQNMLTGLGVRSSVYQVVTSYNGDPYYSWQLAVRDRTALRRLQEIIPVRGSRTVRLRESNIPPRKMKDTATGTLEWDLVVSVERLPDESTVWIEVADHHTHVTGGIVTHNTGKSLHSEIGLQLSALCHADFILRENGDEEPLPHIDGLAGLHLRPRSWKLVEVNENANCFEAFLAAKHIMDWTADVAPGVLP